MAAEVTMPKMGYDMEEGTILQWLKTEGDEVAKGEILGEIETGKVNIEIEAFDAGILRKILVGEGETVPVGTPIALIGAEDEELDLAAYEDGAAGAEGNGAQPSEAVEDSASDGDGAADTTNGRRTERASTGDRDTETEDGGRLRASPLARRIADEHDVDLRRIDGSGPHGRVVRDDVMAAVERGDAALEAPRPDEAPRREEAPAAAPAAQIELAEQDQREPLSGMRRTIARRLSESWQAAPHIFVTMPIRMDRAFALRKEINGALEERGDRISINDLIVKACATALRQHPRLNASWDDGARVERGRVNVGVAVALEDGLMTITVADADRKSVSAIGSEIGEKAERAREGKLTPEDMNTPSTFTVSNLGMYGVEEFTAIINPPEAGILAVGAAIEEPTVEDGEVVVRRVMRVTLSADHRVVDGAIAAEFLVTLKQLLEQPLSMLA